MVLHQGEQNLITFTQIRVAPAACHEIDGLCGVSGEHNLLWTSRSHKGRRCGPCCFKGLGRPGAELMGPAVDVGVVTGVISLKRIQHRPGLLAGGGMIEIDQRTPLRRSLIEDREVGTGPIRQRNSGITRECGHIGREGSAIAPEVIQDLAAEGRRSTTSPQKPFSSRAAASSAATPRLRR